MSKMTPIAIAVVQCAGRFLIGPRGEGQSLSGLWEFPGGKIEAGESPAEAAVRECLEETGLRIEAIGEYPCHIQQYDHDRVQLHFLDCQVSDTRPPKTPFRWVLRAELAEYEFPSGNRQLLELLLKDELI